MGEESANDPALDRMMRVVRALRALAAPPGKQVIGLDFHDVKRIPERRRRCGLRGRGGVRTGQGDKGGGTRPCGFESRNATVRKAACKEFPECGLSAMRQWDRVYGKDIPTLYGSW